MTITTANSNAGNVHPDISSEEGHQPEGLEGQPCGRAGRGRRGVDGLVDQVLRLCRPHDQGGKVMKNLRIVQICHKINQEGVANRAESLIEQPLMGTDVAKRKSGQVTKTDWRYLF